MGKREDPGSDEGWGLPAMPDSQNLSFFLWKIGIQLLPGRHTGNLRWSWKESARAVGGVL